MSIRPQSSDNDKPPVIEIGNEIQKGLMLDERNSKKKQIKIAKID